MPIGGVESAVYGVEELAASARFYDEFGLQAVVRNSHEVVYRLEEGSRVILRQANDPSLPPPHYDGYGVRETIFGIDSVQELEQYESDLRRDRSVRRDPDGTLHFLTDCGIPVGLRFFERRKVTYAPDPVNAADNVKRLNQHRRWRVRALPKTINHIVWRVNDIHASFSFFRDRLHFRLTDYQVDAGVFGRAQGASQHHVLYFQNVKSLPPYTVGFDHLCFGVEDIDEVFAGWNYMQRRGWSGPLGGVGRHRIASSIYCYFDNPCGGKAEYGADTDYLDDNWVPRIWEPRFGGFLWTSQILPFVPEEVEWKVSFDPEKLPKGLIPEKR
jgi:catechol 2,3-dioxygenase-like lactoylglutathione lyase family enzyme